VKRIPQVNSGEETFLFWVKAVRLPVPERNFRFLTERKFEIDFAWPAWRVGVEIQGGIWTGGAHGRPSNILRDLIKHNLLLDAGWRVWHYTPDHVTTGEAVQHLEPILRACQDRDARAQGESSRSVPRCVPYFPPSSPWPSRPSDEPAPF
jgi:very-short-patch-repair endonuclease